MVTGLLFSCKNNNDGYSDEIYTDPNPVDSAGNIRDTAKGVNGSARADNPHKMISDSSSATNAGTGSGPGESPEDGATYTPSRGLPKDSIKPEIKASKKKE